jgi:hypothetical protein
MTPDRVRRHFDDEAFEYDETIPKIIPNYHDQNDTIIRLVPFDICFWRDYIRSNGEDDEKWFRKYLDEDIPAKVEVQTERLRETGFIDVGCHWRYFNFAIFGGSKP